ncbi:hypothetical protein CAXC1_330015 [Candidatus Xenohaliotis californiensis]|uniref:Uncharacterized protein n=1 Tax=Candidatus Xenohaliotis californiensis TaxID=84677 RepID=A0ABP0EWT1_9RICK|nr:hypothetical protein CAXC1_330015 [Candidatus Xenohaliotis californiensis]
MKNLWNYFQRLVFLLLISIRSLLNGENKYDTEEQQTRSLCNETQEKSFAFEKGIEK